MSYMVRLVKPEHRVHVARLLREYRRLNKLFDTAVRAPHFIAVDAASIDAAIRVVGRALRNCGVR